MTTAQVVGWGLTGLGITVSFGWNVVNHVRTNWLGRRLRAEQYRLNQWTQLRSNICQALDGLVSASKIIIRQAQELDENSDGAAFDMLNHLIIDAQDELATALEDAAMSSYCDGTHWREAANGPQKGTETSWDVVLAILEEARAAVTKAEKVDALKKLREPIGEMRTMITSHCRVQDAELEPR